MKGLIDKQLGAKTQAHFADLQSIPVVRIFSRIINAPVKYQAMVNEP